MLMWKMRQFFLEEWEEVTGLLVDVDYNCLVFEEFRVFLAPISEGFLRHTSEFIGERVSVLKTDSLENPFRITLSSSYFDL